jgi:hypothetical protein
LCDSVRQFVAFYFASFSLIIEFISIEAIKHKAIILLI